MHSEGCRQVVTGLSHLGNLQVIPQQLLIVWVSTLLDDLLCTLIRTLSTKVGNTLLSSDDVHVMLCMVEVTAEWNDRTDQTTLGC